MRPKKGKRKINSLGSTNERNATAACENEWWMLETKNRRKGKQEESSII